MLFEFTPSFKEQYLASAAVMLRTPLQLVFLPIFPLVGIAIASLAMMQDRTLTLYEIALVITCFAFSPAVLAFGVWMFRRRNRTVEGILRFTVDDSGLGISGPVFDAHFKWSALTRVTETNRYFLFFISSQMAHFIPKAAVGNRLGELRGIISKNSGGAAA